MLWIINEGQKYHRHISNLILQNVNHLKIAVLQMCQTLNECILLYARNRCNWVSENNTKSLCDPLHHEWFCIRKDLEDMLEKESNVSKNDDIETLNDRFLGFCGPSGCIHFYVAWITMICLNTCIDSSFLMQLDD